MVTVSPLDFFVLRLPLLPVTSLFHLHPDRDNVLRQAWSAAVFREALHTASPTLYEHVSQHLGQKNWPLPDSLASTLWSYFRRMSSRCTPFGLLAGCAPGRVANHTQFSFCEHDRLNRRIRLDTACLDQLTQAVLQQPVIRNQVRFYPSNTVYQVGSQLRYTEKRLIGTRLHYVVSAVEVTLVIRAVLQRAKGGATLQQLTEPLQNRGIDQQEALVFVDELIAMQLLVSELEGFVTGDDPLCYLVNRLGQCGNLPEEASIVSQLKQDLSRANNSSTAYEKVRNTLRPLDLKLPPARWIQTDLFFRTRQNQLGAPVLNTIVEQVAQLHRLNRSDTPKGLLAFGNRFRERYEEQEIPLLLALDSDYGIGYADVAGTGGDFTPLLEGLDLGTDSRDEKPVWQGSESLMVSLLVQSVGQKNAAVDIDDDWLNQLPEVGQTAWPASFYVMGTLLGESANAIDAGDFQFQFRSAAGPSAASLLGRFCQNQPELTELVRAALREEEAHYPDAVFAEIIHISDERAGNIGQRPVLRAYEIPYVNQASVDQNGQILSDDLLVSVRAGGQVVLRSRRLGKEVIPRLSTAHNYRLGLSVYRFLCDLSLQQNRLAMSWDWGMLQDQPFLPRVTYRNLIVSRAQWTLRAGEIKSKAELRQWLAQYRVPRWVSIVDADNELLTDLNTPAGLEEIYKLVSKKEAVRLVEWMATPDRCWIQDEKGAYTNELIIPCKTSHGAPLLPAIQAVPSVSKLSRTFVPGSEWFYVKLYGGNQTADALLRNIVRPLIRNLGPLLLDWFFVRYADPEPHLRLRLRSTNPDFWPRAVQALTKRLAPYLKSGEVYRVQYDTYQREIERYGTATMTLSEAIFTADSQAALDFLSHPTTRELPDSIWQFALRSLDALLTDFGLLLPDKVRFLTDLQQQFLSEHESPRTIRHQLNTRYRSSEVEIHTLLTEIIGDNSSRILSRRSAVNKTLVDAIRQTLQPGVLPDLTALLKNYLHMSMNRLFNTAQREHELVVYHYLARYYTSLQARTATQISVHSTH